VASGGKSATGGKGGTGATGGKGGTSAGGAGGKGGASATGGKGGAGGGGGAGGSSYIGASGITTSPFGGSGGAGGTPDTSAGGTGDAGGAGGTIDTTPIPTDGLAVFVVAKTTGGTGQITLNLRIDNLSPQSVNMSSVTLRYWYLDQGEGLGTSLTLTTYYVKIGYSGGGGVTLNKAVAVSPALAGADSYVELSFTGTLAAKGDTSHNDQFTVNIGLTNGNHGTVDVSNDYSYDGGKTGSYDDKITLYQNGKLISGTEPGGKSSPGPADGGN
jgi:hypothetical protein